jgi:hypothetical protein
MGGGRYEQQWRGTVGGALAALELPPGAEGALSARGEFTIVLGPAIATPIGRRGRRGLTVGRSGEADPLAQGEAARVPGAAASGAEETGWDVGDLIDARIVALGAEGLPTKRLARAVADEFGLGRSEVYNRALDVLSRKKDNRAPPKA